MAHLCPSHGRLDQKGGSWELGWFIMGLTNEARAGHNHTQVMANLTKRAGAGMVHRGSCQGAAIVHHGCCRGGVNWVETWTHPCPSCSRAN